MGIVSGIVITVITIGFVMAVVCIDNSFFGKCIVAFFGLIIILSVWCTILYSSTAQETQETGTTDASTYQTKGGAARFTWYDEEGTEHLFQENQMMIVQDNQTGVRYLVVRDKAGDMCGMTALVDSDGSPNLDPEVGE